MSYEELTSKFVVGHNGTFLSIMLQADMISLVSFCESAWRTLEDFKRVIPWCIVVFQRRCLGCHCLRNTCTTQPLDDKINMKDFNGTVEFYIKVNLSVMVINIGIKSLHTTFNNVLLFVGF